MTNEGVQPYFNERDRGYRCLEVTYQNGKQLSLQLDFSKSDRKFNGNQVLISAAIATDKLAKDRPVMICKQSGYINRGVSHNGYCYKWIMYGCHGRSNVILYLKMYCNWMFANEQNIKHNIS